MLRHPPERPAPTRARRYNSVDALTSSHHARHFDADRDHRSDQRAHPRGVRGPDRRFLIDPFAEIARLAELDVATVHERLRAMLAAGTIRRIRQTLMATNLAPGALVAWRIDNDKLDAAFDFLWKDDPFSGHVVIRSTDAETPGSAYRLWTTLKVPQGFSMTEHCELLMSRIGADAYRVMPAKRLFALGVGHVRRRGMEPGSKTDELGAGDGHEHRRAERAGLARARAAEARVRGR